MSTRILSSHTCTPKRNEKRSRRPRLLLLLLLRGVMLLLLRLPLLLLTHLVLQLLRGGVVLGVSAIRSVAVLPHDAIVQARGVRPAHSAAADDDAPSDATRGG